MKIVLDKEEISKALIAYVKKDILTYSGDFDRDKVVVTPNQDNIGDVEINVEQLIEVKSAE